jgi:hypothetical protein
MGGTLGTAVLLSVLFSSAGANIKDELAKSGQSLPPGKSFDLNDTANLAQLPRAVKHPILVGFSNAMDLVFLVAASIIIIAFFLALFMKEVPLRTLSGNAARAAADASPGPGGATPADPPDASHEADPSGATHEPEVVHTRGAP